MTRSTKRKCSKIFQKTTISLTLSVSSLTIVEIQIVVEKALKLSVETSELMRASTLKEWVALHCAKMKSKWPLNNNVDNHFGVNIMSKKFGLSAEELEVFRKNASRFIIRRRRNYPEQKEFTGRDFRPLLFIRLNMPVC